MGEIRGLFTAMVTPFRPDGSVNDEAAVAIARHLLENGWARVTVDPYRWNERAIRGWRRAGFRDVEEREADEEHTAPWLLMEFGA